MITVSATLAYDADPALAWEKLESSIMEKLQHPAPVNYGRPVYIALHLVLCHALDGERWKAIVNRNPGVFTGFDEVRADIEHGECNRGIAELCASIPTVTSLHLNLGNPGRWDATPVRGLRQLRELALLNMSPYMCLPEGVDHVLASCTQLRTLTLSAFHCGSLSATDVVTGAKLEDMFVSSRWTSPSLKKVCFDKIFAEHLGDVRELLLPCCPGLESLEVQAIVLMWAAGHTADFNGHGSDYLRHIQARFPTIKDRVKHGAQMFAPTGVARLSDTGFTLVGVYGDDKDSEGDEAHQRECEKVYRKVLEVLLREGAKYSAPNVSILLLDGFCTVNDPLVRLLSLHFKGVKHLAVFDMDVSSATELYRKYRAQIDSFGMLPDTRGIDVQLALVDLASTGSDRVTLVFLEAIKEELAMRRPDAARHPTVRIVYAPHRDVHDPLFAPPWNLLFLQSLGVYYAQESSFGTAGRNQH